MFGKRGKLSYSLDFQRSRNVMANICYSLPSHFIKIISISIWKLPFYDASKDISLATQEKKLLVIFLLFPSIILLSMDMYLCIIRLKLEREFFYFLLLLSTLSALSWGWGNLNWVNKSWVIEGLESMKRSVVDVWLIIIVCAFLDRNWHYKI